MNNSNVIPFPLRSRKRTQISDLMSVPSETLYVGVMKVPVPSLNGLESALYLSSNSIMHCDKHDYSFGQTRVSIYYNVGEKRLKMYQNMDMRCMATIKREYSGTDDERWSIYVTVTGGIGSAPTLMFVHPDFNPGSYHRVVKSWDLSLGQGKVILVERL